MSNEVKVELQSSDNEIFEVDEVVASESQMVKDFIKDKGTDSVIPLPNVSSKTLEKVIEYCRYHVDARTSSDDNIEEHKARIKQWDTKFARVDEITMFNLILAANYLNIKNLLELMNQSVANILNGKTPEEIRRVFNIENDFTPEEEQELRRQIQWASRWSAEFM